jgi:hypothetical protein
MSAQPLTLVEQYVYTAGACQVFIAAAHRVVGGKPMVVITHEPSQLEDHGYPTDEPLELHIVLEMPDGSCVDAEGSRNLPGMLSAFGVQEDFDYELKRNAALTALGTPDPARVDALERRLRALGWEQGAPSGGITISDVPRSVFRKAQEQANDWWPQWVATEAIPDELKASPRRPKP